MLRFLPIALLSLALLLAACGGDDEQPAAAAASNPTISVGDGGVLVDSGGRALYTADHGDRCTGGCLAVWLPLTVSGKPTAGDGVPGQLGTVNRGGARQVTYDGAPVFRFSEDGPGDVNGDGAKDEFGGTAFMWTALRTGGSDGGSQDTGGRGGYSY